jgi:hypothetical protein
MTFEYDITDFDWDKHEMTFCADGWDLYPQNIEFVGTEAFPSGRQQFIIRNYKTGGFRRFTFASEGNRYGSNVLVFTSEDNGPICLIYMAQ